MRRVLAVSIVFALLVVACGSDDGATTTTTASTTTTVAPTTTTSSSTTTLSTTTTTLPPEVPFDDGFSQALATGPAEWDSVFVDPGAVVFHDGLWHMFYNGIDTYPAHVNLGYATSPDGLAWTKQVEEPVFVTSDIPYAGVSAFASAAAVLDDGTWAIWLYTVESVNATVGEIARITAPGPLGPWVADPSPAIERGPEGSWYASGVAHPTVLRVGEEWWMWFDGNLGDTATGDRAIGLATSTDGVTWTHHDDPVTTEAPYLGSDPVLRPTPGGWDEMRAYDPGVAQVDDGFVMTWMTRKPGTSQVLYEFGLATSTDGITWEPFERNPFFTSRSVGFNGVFLSTLIGEDGRLVLLMDAQRANGGGTTVFYRLDEVLATP